MNKPFNLYQFMHLRQAQNQPQGQPSVHQVPNFQANPAELQQQLYQQIEEYALNAMATYNVDGSIETVDQAIAAGKLPPEAKAEFPSFMNNLKAGKPQYAALIDEFVHAALGEQVVPQQPEELTEEEEKAMLQQRQQQEEQQTNIHVQEYDETWLRDEGNVLGLFKQKWPRLISGFVGAADKALSDKNKHRFFSFIGEQPEGDLDAALSQAIQGPGSGNFSLQEVSEILEGVSDSKDGLNASLQLLDPIHQYVIDKGYAWGQGGESFKAPGLQTGQMGEKGFDPGESQKLTTKDELSDEEVASINSTLLAENTAETNAYKNIGSEVAGVFRRAQVKGARKGSEYATFADLFEIYTELANSNLTSLMREENIVDLDKFKRTGVGEYSDDKRSLKIEQIRNQPGKFSIITKNFFKKLVSPAEFIDGLEQRAKLRQRIIDADAGGYASAPDKEGYLNRNFQKFAIILGGIQDINPDPSWQRELIESTLVRGQEGIASLTGSREPGEYGPKGEIAKIGNKGVTEAYLPHRSITVMPSLLEMQKENPEQFSSDAMSGFFGMVGSHKFFRDPRYINITKRIRDEHPDLIRGDHGTLWKSMGKTTDDIRSYLGDSPIEDGLPIYIPYLHKGGSSLSDIATGELSNTEIYYRLTSKDGVIPKDKYDMLTDAAAIRSDEVAEYEQAEGHLESNADLKEQIEEKLAIAIETLRATKQNAAAQGQPFNNEDVKNAVKVVTHWRQKAENISQDTVKFVKYRPKPPRKQRKTQEEYVRMKIAMIHSRRIIEARIKMLQARCLTKIAFINAASQYVR